MRFLKSLFVRREAPATPHSAPETAEQAKLRGNAHMAKGELEQAADCYREALRIDPDYAEGYNNLGFVLFEQERYAEAAAMLDMALAIKPDLGPAHLNRGKAAFAMSLYETAERHFRRAAEYMPGNAECHFRLGDTLFAVGSYAAASEAYRVMLDIKPDTAGAHQLPQNSVDAEDLYRQAGVLDANYVHAHWNVALASLLLGDYSAETWRHFEWRMESWKVADDPPKLGDARQHILEFGPERLWRGEELRGKRLLVWGEQGFGDSIMMMRYIAALKDRGAGELILHVAPAIARVLENVTGVDRVLTTSHRVPAECFDVHVSLMSLPARCGARADDVGGLAPPYLRVPPEMTARWRTRLAALHGRKIGLVWGGNKDLAMDKQRSIPLEAFASLLQVPGTAWISLQKGEPAAQLKALGWPITDWMDECVDMLDTAALVAGLDLVVSVDTSVAHLAGALGRPVWLLNRYQSEWRWMLGREDSPWYPSMRLFNQAAALEWNEPIARIRAALDSGLAAA